MTIKRLQIRVKEAYNKGKRLIAPLIGFPGIDMIDTNIKIAQQNYMEHFKVIKTLYDNFKPDIVFPFMDLSVEANAIGCTTIFNKNEPATVANEKFNEKDLEIIKKINIAYDSRLLCYVDTVKQLKNNLPDSVLIGSYVTGPYTLAGMIIGAEKAALSTVMHPEEFKGICESIVRHISTYIDLLIEAGADAICILDPSAIMLGPEYFEQFAAKYVHQLLPVFENSKVASIYHICGNSSHLMHEITKLKLDAISLDAKEVGVDLAHAADILPDDMIIFGNISTTQIMLTAKPEEVEYNVKELLKTMEPFPNFILSTGCDLPQKTPLENIHAFISSGRQYSNKKIS